MGFAPVECLHESSSPNKEKQPLCFALIDSFPAHKIPLMMNRRHWRNAIQPSTALFLPRHDNVVSPCIDGWTFWLRFAQSLRLLTESVQRNWIAPHHSKRAVLGYITQSTAIGNAPRTEQTHFRPTEEQSKRNNSIDKRKNHFSTLQNSFAMDLTSFFLSPPVRQKVHAIRHALAGIFVKNCIVLTDGVET